MITINTKELADYNPFYAGDDGKKTWSHCPGDVYHVTGVDCSGKRFKVITSNWAQASMVNVWQGTKWLVRGGRRFKITSTYN